MTEQPEALSFADRLTSMSRLFGPDGSHDWLCRNAATELRRQHAEIERLKAENEALRRDAELGRWIREETPPIEEIAARVDGMEEAE